MKFLIFILFVLAVIFIIWRISRGGKIEIVAHAKLLFKTWSVWLASLGSVTGAWVQSFPDAATNAWSELPEDVKSFLPQHYLGLGAAFMVAMAVIAQFVRQRKLVDEMPAVSATAAVATPAASVVIPVPASTSPAVTSTPAPPTTGEKP